MNFQSIPPLLFLSLLLLLGCGNETQSKKRNDINRILDEFDSKKIIIAGEIDSPLKVHKLYITSKFGDSEIFFDSLKFMLELEEEFPVLLSIHEQKHRSIPIFAMPGDSIFISFQLNGILFEEHSHKYKGDRTKENEILLELEKILTLDNPKFINHFNISEKDFITKIDSLKNHGISLKSEYCKRNKINNPYFDYSYEVFLKYRLGQIIKLYPNLLRRHLIKPDFELSSNYYAQLRDLTIEDSRLLNHYPYLNYLLEEVNSKSGRVSNWSIKFLAIDSLYSDKEIKDHLKFYLAKNDLDRFNKFKKMILKMDKNEIDSEKPKIKDNSIPTFELKDRFKTGIELYRTSNPPINYLEIIEASYEKLIDE